MPVLSTTRSEANAVSPKPNVTPTKTQKFWQLIVRRLYKVPCSSLRPESPSADVVYPATKSEAGSSADLSCFPVTGPCDDASAAGATSMQAAAVTATTAALARKDMTTPRLPRFPEAPAYRGTGAGGQLTRRRAGALV